MSVFARDRTDRKPPTELRLDDSSPSPTMEAISRGSHEAFAVLFDRTCAAVAADLTARVAEPRRRTAILAATYVEVWWLAGCRSDADADETQWIRSILDRRVTEPHRPEAGPGRAERELADLLGRPVEELWPNGNGADHRPSAPS
ncbi:hypothetical protein [Actinoplanes sp. HUAS TT8]|uniref:hypothetical protein n=1 Tax=Actinoplanes sp. HUAS TT8 TaxID=3447453 RepID=UPI003F524A7D